MSEFYTNVGVYGNCIEYRGYKNGKRVSHRRKHKPTLYLPTKEKTGWRAYIKNTPVKPFQYDSIKEARQLIQFHKECGDSTLYGNYNFVSQYIQEKYPDEIKFDRSNIHVLTKDIEVLSEDGFPEPNNAKHPIVSIAMHSSKTDEFYVLGTHKSQRYSKQKTELNIDKDKIFYIHFDTEQELLIEFCKLWNKLDIDVVTGWYIRGFDIPYLINRIERLFGENQAKILSPWKRVRFKPFYVKGNEIPAYEIAGIAQLDYLDIFQKFGYVYGPQENYKLDTIANAVLKERKLDYDEYGNLTSLYHKNFQKYIDYNIRDVDLVVRIDKETDLLSLALTVAYMAGTNYQDSLGTTAIWSSIIYREMMQRKIVPSAVKKDNAKTDFAGGYVKEPIPGNYRWICSFDLNSLYPNLLIQYNMSPETFKGMKDGVCVDDYINEIINNENLDISIAANGACFDNSFQGIIPEITENFYNLRKSVQAEYYELENNDGDIAEIRRLNNKQWAIKILLNSLYGAISNAYFLYFYLQIAEAVTLSGQMSIKWIEKKVNEYLNKKFGTKDKDYIIAIDTDSIYVDMSGYISDEMTLDESIDHLNYVCNGEMQNVINVAYEILADRTSSFKNRMVMKREVIADRGLWTAKKRYILNIWDKEGKRYEEPKLKITGIEAIKSTTPEILRNKMKELYKVLLMETEEEGQSFVEDFKGEFKKLNPEDISFPKGVNGLEKFSDKKTLYKKGTPMHVRASLIYNKLLKEKGVVDKYRPIASGDKIRYIYLKLPNPTGENVIAFPDVLPEEFDLHRYIDYNTQFEKGFSKPLEPIFGAFDFTVEESPSLADWI